MSDASQRARETGECVVPIRIPLEHGGTPAAAQTPPGLGSRTRGWVRGDPLSRSPPAAWSQRGSPGGRGAVPGSPARLGERADASEAAGRSQSSWNLSTRAPCQFTAPQTSGEFWGEAVTVGPAPSGTLHTANTSLTLISSQLILSAIRRAGKTGSLHFGDFLSHSQLHKHLLKKTVATFTTWCKTRENNPRFCTVPIPSKLILGADEPCAHQRVHIPNLHARGPQIYFLPMRFLYLCGRRGGGNRPWLPARRPPCRSACLRGGRARLPSPSRSARLLRFSSSVAGIYNPGDPFCAGP